MGRSWMPTRIRVLGETFRWVRLSPVVMTKLEHFGRVHTYSLGETIRLELDLLDRSGVLTVNATFYETEPATVFRCAGTEKADPK